MLLLFWNVSFSLMITFCMEYCSEVFLSQNRSSRQRWDVLWEKVFSEISQNSQENTCARVPETLSIKLQAEACNFIEKETLVQVFSCWFCEISKSTFFTEHLWATRPRCTTWLIICDLSDSLPVLRKIRNV